MWSTWKRISPLSSCPSDRIGAARYWLRRAEEAELRGDKAAALRRRARAAALDPHGLASSSSSSDLPTELAEILKTLRGLIEEASKSA